MAIVDENRNSVGLRLRSYTPAKSSFIRSSPRFKFLRRRSRTKSGGCPESGGGSRPGLSMSDIVLTQVSKSARPFGKLRAGSGAPGHTKSEPQPWNASLQIFRDKHINKISPSRKPQEVEWQGENKFPQRSRLRPAWKKEEQDEIGEEVGRESNELLPISGIAVRRYYCCIEAANENRYTQHYEVNRPLSHSGILFSHGVQRSTDSLLATGDYTTKRER